MARGRQPELAGMDATLTMWKVYKSMATPAAEFVMKQLADRTLMHSQKYVPVDTGSLKASGNVEKVDSLTYRVTYGANHGKPSSAFGGIAYRDPWYAIFVHEGPSKGGGPPTKFLERGALDAFAEAVNENGPNFMKAIERGGAPTGATDTSGNFLPPKGWEQPWESDR